MSPRAGEVWMADLGFAAKFRPVVIVSRQDPDPPRALVIYVPITTQDRESSYEVKLPKTRFLEKNSVANVQGIASLPTVRLSRRVGTLPVETVREIKKAIAWALELEPPDISSTDEGSG
jgi:mRNA interferase MazF